MLLGSLLMQIIIVIDNYTVNINERANLLYFYIIIAIVRLFFTTPVLFINAID